MTSEDFVKIFYSYPQNLNIDWNNIDEIAWMYEEGLFVFSSDRIATQKEFINRIDIVMDPKNGFMRNGESYGHLALKTFGRDYLIKRCGIVEKDVMYEYPFIGFEVDVIDKGLHYPVECGSTNALKFEKYLQLSSTVKMFVLPYPHLEDLKIFQFCVLPAFFKYIKHKKEFLNRKNAKFR